MAVYQGSLTVKRRPKDGNPGDDGDGIVSTTIEYAKDSSGTTPPTSGWSTSIPSPTVGWYLWTRTTTTYKKSDTTVSYSVSYWAEDGDGIVSTTIEYAKSSSGTTPPTSGWSTSIPSPTVGWYLWTRTTTTYKKSDTTVSYSVSYWAEDGDGIVSTTIEYAKSSSGTTPPTSGWSTSIPSPTVGWYLWTRTTTTYKKSATTIAYSVSYWAKDGEPGSPGLPGQVPIQKEWVVGDTHRFNDEIKDFIYVRGASSDTSYWYTRTNKGDVVAGSPPVGGANVEGYTRVDWMRNLAVKVLLAEEANLANFIFKDEQLISVRGTVNGVETNYSGQAGFKPYIILDGKTGKIYAEGAEISGIINALSGAIGHLTIEELGRVIMKDPATAKERLIFANHNIPTVATLESETQFDGSISVSPISVSPSYPNGGSSGMTVSQDGSKIVFNGATINITGTLSGTAGGFASAALILVRNGVNYYTYGSANIYLTGGETKSDSVVVPAITLTGLPSGSYAVKLALTYSGTFSSLSGSSSSSTLSWSFSKDVEWFQFGLNGMMSWWQNVHAYFSNSEISFRAPSDKWNAPGVLLSATVNAGGGWDAIWGAKRSSTQPVNNSTGRYTVYHTVGHTNYQVNAIPNTANRTCHIVSKAASNFVIEWRTVSSSPTLVNTGFDFQIIGNNYA